MLSFFFPFLPEGALLWFMMSGSWETNCLSQYPFPCRNECRGHFPLSAIMSFYFAYSTNGDAPVVLVLITYKWNLEERKKIRWTEWKKQIKIKSSSGLKKTFYSPTAHSHSPFSSPFLIFLQFAQLLRIFFFHKLQSKVVKEYFQHISTPSPHPIFLTIIHHWELGFANYGVSIYFENIRLIFYPFYFLWWLMIR